MIDLNLFHAAMGMIPVAAAGWAVLYMLCGGGFGGAIILFVVLKMFGK